MTTRRQEKANALIRRELAEVLQRKVSDPRLQSVHIVKVDVSPDFHLARVNYSFLSDDIPAEDVQKGLDSAKPFLRRELKKVLQLRVLPELAFFFDPSIKQGDHILELLKSVRPSD